MLETVTDKQYLQAWAVCSTIFFITFYRWPGRRLDHIPTLGTKSQLLSYFGAFEYLFRAKDMAQRGCDMFGHSIFRIPTLGKWVVVVNGPKFIEEVRKSPEDELSFYEALKEQIQIEYTLGSRILDNPYQISIIRSQLTRNLAPLFPSLQEEVSAAFNDIIPASADWTKYKALKTVMPIVCRASNRIFVGAPLCRDPEFMKINLQFTITVVKAARILRLLPSFLRPIASYFLTSVSTSIDRAVEHLLPSIEERRRNIEEHGKNYPDKPSDILSWLMDEAEGDEVSPRNLTLRILAVNFAAIHTSSMTFTHTLFNLAAYPEFIQPMREEIEEIVNREGWTHAALGQMTKVDSFIKETQRHKSLSCLTMGRIAQKPFTFSDGTYIPVGTTLRVAVNATHFDSANYPDPQRFDPFRFVDKTAPHNRGRKVDMASTHADFVAFGHGRHACPGRFFAANEIKLMLAHMIVTYDIKLEGARPEDVWYVAICMPNPKGEVMFRKRRE